MLAITLEQMTRKDAEFIIEEKTKGNPRDRSAHSRSMDIFTKVLCHLPSIILTNTEVFRKPVDFFDSSAIYIASKLSGIKNILTIPDLSRPGHPVVNVFFTLMERVSDSSDDIMCSDTSYFNMVMSIDVSTLIPEELRTDDMDMARWYIYILNTLTYFHQETTFFVNIDNEEKFSAALKRYQDGTYRLPFLEFAFINGKTFETHNTPFKYSGRVVGMNQYGGLDVQPELGYENTPVTSMPELDMTGIEDRMYDLFIFQLFTQKVAGCDTETTGLDIFMSELVSLGITFNTKMSYYLSFAHLRPDRKSMVIGSMSFIADIAAMKRKFNVKNAINFIGFKGADESNLSKDQLMIVAGRMKEMDTIWHNAKFDYNIMLTATGIQLPVWLDTMLAHYVTRPGGGEAKDIRRSLKIIACKELEVPQWKVDITLCQHEEKDVAAAYNARDCCYMMGMAYLMGNDIDKNKDLIFNVEMAFLPVLAGAERFGVKLDVNKLKEIEHDLTVKTDAVVEKFSSMSDDKENFNINSGPMLKDLFFNKWKVEPPHKCKTCGFRHYETHNKCVNETCRELGVDGSAPYEFTTPAGDPSLDKFVLSALDQKGDTRAHDLLEYRLAMKLVSSYCHMDKKIHPYTGMIHPTYNQAKTATGRLSSSNPNFQLAA